MIAVRLNQELEKELEVAAIATGITKSELIRKSIIEFLEKNKSKNAWELGKDLFGKYDLENENLAEDAEKILRNKFKNKS